MGRSLFHGRRILGLPELVVTQFRFGQAATLGMLGMLCFDFAVLAHFRRLPNGGTPDLAIFISALLPIFAGLRYRMELASRKAFLLRALNQLHVQSLASANATLTRLAQLDPLTGLFNRGYFDAALARLWSSMRVSGRCLGMAMVDVDHFKSLNDSAGHEAGDRCLEAVASAIRISVRIGQDIVARYGGEEFVVILPDAGLEDAIAIGERVRLGVENLGLRNPKATPPLLTVSVGVTSVQPNGDSPLSLVRTADRALYQAKFHGRNRLATLLCEGGEELAQISTGGPDELVTN